MPETQDEDQSITDDEEFDRVTYDYGNLGSPQSLYRSKKKDQNSVLSQLEILQRGGSNLAIANSCNPNFYDREVLDTSKENKTEGSTWSGALREAEELDYLHEQKSSSGSRKAQKCTKVKAGPKFSIHIQSYKGRHSQPSGLNSIFEDSTPNVKKPWPLESFQKGIMEHSNVKLIDQYGRYIENVSKASQKDGEISEAAVHGGTEHSMAELLDDLYKKNGASGGGSSMNGNIKNKRRIRFAGKKVVNVLGSRNLDNEDPLLPMDSNTSSEDENQLVQPNLLVSCMKASEIRRQTVAEKFQEVFSSVDTSEPHLPISKYMGSGYHGRLQQVVQKEKNQHLVFLKLLQTGSSQYEESRCIVVQILSRYLDAKLTVCDCLFGKNSESFQSGKRPQKSENGEEYWRAKIIFSPIICDDVELEVGNLVRLYPPWKEVQLRKNENILLCTYFSQLQS